MPFYDLSAEVTVLVVAVLLVLTMRWVFGSSRPRLRPPVDASDARELGLLTVVRTAVPRSEAMAQRASLTAAGIRSSVSRRRDGRLDVLVFTDDVDRARATLDA